MQNIHAQGYIGNKGHCGSYQNIINEFPPHENFVSGCAGSGQVEKRKKLAPGRNIVFELNPDTIKQFWNCDTAYTVRNEDCLKWLAEAKKKLLWGPTLTYFDPPYYLPSRRNGRSYYKHEWSKEQHEYFLNLVKNFSDMYIAISHYRCQLYDTILKDWRVKTWQVSTHQGKAVEALYMNYDKPTQLHQYDYLGDNFTDRQRIKRMGATLHKQLTSATGEDKIALIQELYMLLEISKMVK